jgi:predicted phosphodiesterase
MISKVLGENGVMIVFYGHTHEPWIEERRGVKVINPGTLGGVFANATFAVWDTEKKDIKLMILDLIKGTK